MNILTNRQRSYLALQIIEDSWEILQINKSTLLIFDGDIVRKLIESDENKYIEIEMNRITSENRTVLPPLTKNGKPKKLTYSSIKSSTPVSSYFSWSKSRSGSEVIIGNHTTERTYFSSVGSGIKFEHWEDVVSWIESWIKDTTESDLEDMKNFRIAPRKKYAIKEGDFFSFKIGRREYGFGRVLLDGKRIKKLVKTKKTHLRHYGLINLMGQPLMINVYQVISQSPTVSIEKLLKAPVFSTQPIFDNRLYYGDFHIFGNMPLQSSELDFPVSIGSIRLPGVSNVAYLQYGLIYIEKNYEQYMKLFDKLKKISEDPYFGITLANNSIGYSIRLLRDIKGMKAAINEGDIYYNSGIHHPDNAEIKEELFSFFGLNSKMDYSENLDLFIKENQI